MQGFYRHDSTAIGLPMQFGVYVPPQAKNAPVPALFYLAGLTCNEETFAIKAGAQRYAAEHGLIIVTPDTSPRNTGIEGADASWDFGTAAGFYLDAVRPPWTVTGRWKPMWPRSFPPSSRSISRCKPIGSACSATRWVAMVH